MLSIIFVIEENATYVVTGAATVMKLAASTADSIDELVAALQSDINTLKGIVGALWSWNTIYSLIAKTLLITLLL